MRHAEFTAAIAPLAPARATAPLANGGAGGGKDFGAIFGEVADFIQHGDAAPAPALSAEGRMWAARSRPADGAGSPGQQAFLDSIAPWAREAAGQLGVTPELVSAHAALESGWGQHPLRNADGSPSNNLFGIKAGAAWRGATAEAATTEYIDGAAFKTSARFRSYPDQASAFRDYARLLSGNPRFRDALGAGGDAQAFTAALARGGYATDPAYATKLERLAARLQGVKG
jgi:flagellar protein FlgJ